MAIISINYNEGSEEEDLGYKSIAIRMSNSKDTFTFDSGDFVKDWYNAIKKYIEVSQDEHLMFSSSVDHFIMDGAKFDKAWVVLDDELKPFILYEYDERGLQIFVNEGTKPTWDEYKQYVKS